MFLLGGFGKWKHLSLRPAVAVSTLDTVPLTHGWETAHGCLKCASPWNLQTREWFEQAWYSMWYVGFNVTFNIIQHLHDRTGVFTCWSHSGRLQHQKVKDRKPRIEYKLFSFWFANISTLFFFTRLQRNLMTGKKAYLHYTCITKIVLQFTLM